MIICSVRYLGDHWKNREEYRGSIFDCILACHVDRHGWNVFRKLKSVVNYYYSTCYIILFRYCISIIFHYYRLHQKC